MAGSVFIDTNVLVYARDLKEKAKREQARLWLSALAETGLGILNLQTLNELTRWILKNETSRTAQEIRDEIDVLRVWGDKPLADDEVSVAWEVRERFGFQWFDCLLLAAAARSECSYFLTEDLTEGAVFGPVTIIHPFRTSPGDILFKD